MRGRRIGASLATAVLLVSGCGGIAGSPMASDPPARSAEATTPTSPSPAPPVLPSVGPSVGPSTTPTATAAADVYAATRDDVLVVQETRGTRAALDLLARRIEEVPAVAGVCHAIAHELAHHAVEHADGDARRALSLGSEVCGGGFTHGVIETVLGASTNPARDLLRVCAPENTGSCFHGVGHGVMLATGLDVGASLDLCDRAPSRTLSARCGEGVFMQLFSSDLSAQHVSGSPSLAIARDPLATQQRCQRTRADYAANCWFYAPTVYLTVHPDDFAGALDWCRSADSAATMGVCARGVGSRTVKYHPDDLTIGARACQQAGRLQDPCLQGMGSYWSVHHEGRVAPVSVCRQLTGAVRERCRSVV